MLTALALLALIETAPVPRVEVTLKGVDSAPVSAARRTLQDVARELREGRKSVGGFSAVETTVPRNLAPVPPLVYWEEPEAVREPEPVVEPPPPTYVETWFPASYGGGRRGRVPAHRHPGHRPGMSAPGPRPTPHSLASPEARSAMRR